MKTILTYTLVIVGVYLLINMLTGGSGMMNNTSKTEEVAYSTLVQNIDADNVKSIEIDSKKYSAKTTLKNGDKILVTNVSVAELDKILTDYIRENPGEIEVKFQQMHLCGLV